MTDVPLVEKRLAIIDTCVGALFPSDHFPVTADVVVR